MKVSLEQKLFVRAFHISSVESERATAVQQLFNRVNSGGSSSDYQLILCSDMRELLEELAKLNDYAERVTDGYLRVQKESDSKDEALRKEQAKRRKSDAESKAVRASLDACYAEIDRLRAENEALKVAADVKSDVGTEYIPWGTFAKACDRAFGHPQWKAIFASRADIDVSRLRAWQKVEIAPASFLKLLETLKGEQRASSSHKPWTMAEVEILTQLVQQGLTDYEIAKVLTERFGRRLLETAITRTRRRCGIRRSRQRAGSKPET